MSPGLSLCARHGASLPSRQPSADRQCACTPSSALYRQHYVTDAADTTLHHRWPGQWLRLKLGTVWRQWQEPPTHYCSFGERQIHTVSSGCHSDWSEAAVAMHNQLTKPFDIAPFITRFSLIYCRVPQKHVWCDKVTQIFTFLNIDINNEVSLIWFVCCIC